MFSARNTKPLPPSSSPTPAKASIDLEEKYPLPVVPQAVPSVNEQKNLKKTHKVPQHKKKHYKTQEEREIDKTRRARSLREPDFLDLHQRAFQNSLKPQLSLKCELKDHFMKHVLWKAKVAAEAKAEKVSDKQKKQVRFKV